MTSIASSFAISSLVDISAAADKLRIIASAPEICQAGPDSLIYRVALLRVPWRKENYKNLFPVDLPHTNSGGPTETAIYAETACGVPVETRVSTSGPSSVMAIVCSACALG